MMIYHIFKLIYIFSIHNLVGKVVPRINDPICEKMFVMSGVSVFFLQFVRVISSIREECRGKERLGGEGIINVMG